MLTGTVYSVDQLSDVTCQLRPGIGLDSHVLLHCWPGRVSLRSRPRAFGLDRTSTGSS